MVVTLGVAQFYLIQPHNILHYMTIIILINVQQSIGCSTTHYRRIICLQYKCCIKLYNLWPQVYDLAISNN